MENSWVIYILECKDGSLYTGITNDLTRRIALHEAGKGAKYTRGRAPLTLRYAENCENYSQALRREIEIKKLTKSNKLALCATYNLPR